MYLNLLELQLLLFSYKNLSRIPRKIFATQWFFTDHLKYKTANKATSRTPSANPNQLCAHWLKSFPTAMISVLGFQGFLIYVAKYFWSLLNSSYLIFFLLIWISFFCKSNVNKINVYNRHSSFTRVLESKKKRLALTSSYCVVKETWLDASKKLICINQSRFYNFFHVGKFKNV